jgi:hypothetical protein
MLSLIVGVALATGLSQDGPAQAPVFKSGAYVIAIEIPVFHARRWNCGSKPDTGLTIDDFTVSLDRKLYTPIEVIQDAKRPGRYLLSFTVSEAVRDGKEHRIDVSIRKRGGLHWTTTIPKPSPDGGPYGQVEDWLSEMCK